MAPLLLATAAAAASLLEKKGVGPHWSDITVAAGARDRTYRLHHFILYDTSTDKYYHILEFDLTPLPLHTHTHTHTHIHIQYYTVHADTPINAHYRPTHISSMQRALGEQG